MTSYDLYILWILFFVAGIPFALKLIELNNDIGFRFATTKRDPAIWKKVNAFAGWCLILCSVIGALFTYLWPDMVKQWEAIIVIGFFTITIVATFMYMKKAA